MDFVGEPLQSPSIKEEQFRRKAIIIQKSPFVNERTMNLISFYRKKYHTGEVNLSKAIPLIVGFYKNFGLEFEELPDGNDYCHVLDI